MHLHIARSMLHLSRHTNTYIPLTPYLLPIVSSQLTLSSKPKPSTLRPFDFESNIRAPAQYLKTRVYMEGLIEEATFTLAEWLISAPVHGSIAFPEITVPIVVTLRKTLKTAKSATKGGGAQKQVGVVKTLVERIEESAQWMEQQRKGVQFGPGKLSEVEMWEANLRVDESPLAKYVKVQRKVRAKRKDLVDKVRVWSCVVWTTTLTWHSRRVYRLKKVNTRSWTTSKDRNTCHVLQRVHTGARKEKQGMRRVALILASVFSLSLIGMQGSRSLLSLECPTIQLGFTLIQAQDMWGRGLKCMRRTQWNGTATLNKATDMNVPTFDVSLGSCNELVSSRIRLERDGDRRVRMRDGPSAHSEKMHGKNCVSLTEMARIFVCVTICSESPQICAMIRRVGDGHGTRIIDHLQMLKKTCHQGRRMPCALRAYPWTRR